MTGKGAEQSLIHAGVSVASGDDLDLQSFHGVRQLAGEDYIAILQGSTAKQAPATPFAIAVFTNVFNGDPDEAIVLSDDWAPEHLEIHAEDVDYYHDRLRNYGSLFIGEETTVAYGDKAIGTNHILPTSRSARYTGGVWVGKFLKTVTYQKMTPAASVEVGRVTERQCEMERMLAHAVTADVRIKRYGQGHDV